MPNFDRARSYLTAPGPLGAQRGYWTALVALIGWAVLRSFIRYARRPPIPDTAENREWLARILMTEAAFRGEPDYEEWAGISWVAINRALRSGTGRVRVVVDTSSWFGKAPPARMYPDSLLRTGNGPKAVAFVNAIFEGKVANFIGDRWHFFHISGMPTCSQTWAKNASGSRICIDYGGDLGKHWAPKWGVHPFDGGSAKNSLVLGKRTVFV